MNSMTSIEPTTSPSSDRSRYWRWADPHLPAENENQGAETGSRHPFTRSTKPIECDDDADRLALIEDIRTQIADGAYESERKMEIALDRLIDELICDEPNITQ
jgi:hypothetical protein